MVFNFTDTNRFYCYSESVDMRKGIHSLYAIIKQASLTMPLMVMPIFSLTHLVNQLKSSGVIIRGLYSITRSLS